MKYLLITEVNRNTGDSNNVGLVLNVQDAVSFIRAVNSECGEMKTSGWAKDDETGLNSIGISFEKNECSAFTVSEVKVINNVTNEKVYY